MEMDDRLARWHTTRTLNNDRLENVAKMLPLVQKETKGLRQAGI